MDLVLESASSMSALGKFAHARFRFALRPVVHRIDQERRGQD
jgi:hypothetical protein